MTDLVSRPPGLEAAGMVKIQAGIGRMRDALDGLDHGARVSRLAQEMYQVPMVWPIMPITAGSGTLGDTDNTGPTTGYYWSVRRLSIQGFSAGSVLVYRNGLISGTTVIGTPEVVPSAPQAGVNTFGRGEVLLNPNDWLAFSATGITVAAGYSGVQLQGTADCFPVWLLAEYLM